MHENRAINRHMRRFINHPPRGTREVNAQYRIMDEARTLRVYATHEITRYVIRQAVEDHDW